MSKLRCHYTCVAFAGAVDCLHTSWLWQCNTSGSEWTVDGATSVCSARRCSADLLQTEVRARNATAHWTALVVCTWAHSVQSSNLRCSFSVVSMVLLRHTLLTSCSRWQPWSHAEGCDPRPPPDWTSRGRDGLPLATVHSVSPVLASGTVCRHRRRVHRRCLFLGGCWNANCSIAVTISANW